MFVFITTIISITITILLMFGTKVQTKTRKKNVEYWCDIDWIETTNRPKWPLWVLILAFICCIIPVLNILWSVSFFVWYIIQLKEPYSNDGYNLQSKRIVCSNKITKFLTKEI